MFKKIEQVRKMLLFVFLASAFLTVLQLPASALDLPNNCTTGTLSQCISRVLKASDNPSTNSGTYSSTYKCGRHQAIDFGSRHLTTNLWGAPPDENISPSENCVYKDYDGTFGWTWNRTEPVTFSGEKVPAPIYPSAGTGTDPWGGYSTSKYLPIRIINISSFTIDVRYQYSTLPPSSDSVNLAYDIWITDTNKPNPETPRKEVMIWINRLNVPMPEDRLGEDVSDGYNTYRQYAMENYTAFVIDVAPSSGTKYLIVNPKKLIDYLVAKGKLSGDLWLSKIDFGNEVWDSIGVLKIYHFNIKLNGVSI